MVRMDKPCVCPSLQEPHGREEHSHPRRLQHRSPIVRLRISYRAIAKIARSTRQISFAADVEPAGVAKSNVVEVVMASPRGTSTATSTSAD